MIRDKQDSKPVIDLTGPEGNAFALMGMATRWGKQLSKTKPEIDAIIKEMTSGDYEHLLEVIDREFGEYVIFER